MPVAFRKDLPRGKALLELVTSQGGLRATSRLTGVPYTTIHDEWRRAGGGSGVRKPEHVRGMPLCLDDADTMFLPDLQAPAHHPDAIPFLEAVRDKYKPTHIVAIGDEVDFCWLSDYGKQVEADNPSAEYDNAIAFMRQLYAAFPCVYALNSNHVQGRVERARLRGRLPKWMIKDLPEILDAPITWQWYDELIIGDILVRHGHKDSANLKRSVIEDIPSRFGRHYSIIVGHHHTKFGQTCPDILVGDRVFWGAFTGCLINPAHPFFSYSHGNERLGTIVTKHGRPVPVPLRLDRFGRWTGQI